MQNQQDKDGPADVVDVLLFPSCFQDMMIYSIQRDMEVQGTRQARRREEGFERREDDGWHDGNGHCVTVNLRFWDG